MDIKDLKLTKGQALLVPCLFMMGCNQQDAKKQAEDTNAKDKPNIVMFFTDDNAFWYWGFGGGPDLSPNIDKIGEQGVECTQFYAEAPVCTPSRYSLQTGKYAGRCQSTSFLSENPNNEPYCISWNTYLSDSKETTMGEVFQQGGYETGFVGKWHLGEDHSKFDFNPDADPSDPKVDEKLKAYQKYIQDIVKQNGYDYAASITPSNNDVHPVKAVQYHNLEWMAKGAIDFIKQSKNNNKPFFLIINITTHHGPCHRESLSKPVNLTQAGFVDGLDGIMPPRESVFERIEEAGHEVDFKTSGTVWTDDLVKAVLDNLGEQGLENETAVVFTTDHNRYDGKATCYQGGVHIPFLMKYPGVIQKGTNVDTRFQMIDLFPTYMDMCNIDMPQNIVIDGVSMWPVLKGGDVVKKHDALFFEFGYTRAVLKGDFKYIALRYPENLLRKMKSGEVDKSFSYTGKTGHYPNALRYPHYYDPEQLYNIKEDYEEQNNLAGEPQYKEKLNELKDLLRTHLETFEHPFPLDEVDEFYYSGEYMDMCEKARESINMDQYYWYQHECY